MKRNSPAVPKYIRAKLSPSDGPLYAIVKAHAQRVQRLRVARAAADAAFATAYVKASPHSMASRSDP